ncbi:MAG: acyltransferase [Ilumatobacter sp.]|uniref:acyltransferase n=1 Tax=Ilumatobacter sp. TaxID=1967498 RepID=UPI0026222B90|nr:acyltransferase [Ilumatobacter sp.]MDJ0769198.1 acyltransferase [Ilumatobacter sp.]
MSSGPAGRVRALFADEPDRRTAVQMLLRTLVMAARGMLTNASCSWPPRPVLRGRRVQLLNRHRISIGPWSVLEDDAQIQGRSTGGIRLGARVSVGRGAQIRPSGFYGRSPGRGLVVGDDSNIGPMNYVGCSETITIGARCLLGPNVNIFTEWHEFEDAGEPIKAQGVGAEPVVLEDDCWIGAGSIILPGVVVGRGAVVAAGSVVTHDVPPRTLVAGVPAAVKRSLAAG